MTRYIIRLHEGVDVEAFAAEVPNVERVLPRVRMIVAELDAAQAETLQADPRVEFVEEDQTGEGADAGGSQEIVNEWHLDRIDQRALPLDGTYEWDRDGTGVRIYILDTGIRGTHEAFSGRIGPGWSAFAAPNDDPYEDPDGHGTRVAGAAAGLTTGPARGATVCSVRFASHSGIGGSSSSDVAAGVDWILDEEGVRGGPAVVNFSYSNNDGIVAAAFQELINAGILVFTSAGNDGTVLGPSTPVASIPEVMHISSTESDDSFGPHNYGSRVDLLAPGIDIWTTRESGDTDYGSSNGTSFASPLAAGVAALLLEQEPTLPPAHVRGLLCSQATIGEITDVPANTTDRLLHAHVEVTEQPLALGPVYYRVGTIAKRTGTGQQAESWLPSGSWNVDDVTPKAVLFWYAGVNESTIADDMEYGNNRIGIGVATAGAQYVLVATQQLASGTSLNNRRGIRNDRVIHIQNVGDPNVPSGTLARASLASLDPNGFTLNWDLNANTNPYVINYLALGGDGIEDVGLTDWALSGHGFHGVTDAGFSDPFTTPDCVLHFNAGGVTAVASGNTSLTSSHSALGMGVMTRNGGQWAWGVFASGGSPSNSRRVQRTDAGLVAASTDEADGTSFRAFLHSMHEGGFTIDVDKNIGSGQRIISLAIRGGIWAAAAIDQPVSTGSQAVTDLGFNPVGLIFGSFMRPASSDGVNDSRFMIGASDGVNARSLAAIHPTGLSSSNIISRNRSTANPVLISTANDLTPNGIAALDSLDEGGFTLDWTTTDSTDAEVLYLAFAGVTVEPPPVPTGLTAVAVNHESIQLTWEPGIPE